MKIARGSMRDSLLSGYAQYFPRRNPPVHQKTRRPIFWPHRPIVMIGKTGRLVLAGRAYRKIHRRPVVVSQPTVAIGNRVSTLATRVGEQIHWLTSDSPPP